MVRHALPSDIPAMVELAYREHELSPWKSMAFDSVYVGMMVHSFVSSYGRVMFRSERGYLAGLVQTFGFSRELVAMEYAMFCEDGQGMALIKAFEDWSKRMGAKAVIVHDYMGDGRLGRVLQRRRGFEPLGAALVKRH